MKIVCFIGEKVNGNLVNIKELNKFTAAKKAEIATALNIQACTAVNYVKKEVKNEN